MWRIDRREAAAETGRPVEATAVVQVREDGGSGWKGGNGEREGSEQSQDSILGGDTLQVPRRAQSELGQPLPSGPRKEFISLKSPFNSATLQKTEKTIL